MGGRSRICCNCSQGVSPYKGTAETAGPNVSGDLNPGNQSVNGGREASNGFMVNGGDVNDGLQNGAAIIPNLDSISEFRIITNNFDAEYGNFSGGQVNVVTKSGQTKSTAASLSSSEIPISMQQITLLPVSVVSSSRIFMVAPSALPFTKTSCFSLSIFKGQIKLSGTQSMKLYRPMPTGQAICWISQQV